MATGELVPAGALVPAVAAGMTVRDGFAETSVERSAETSATALAEREKATIQAMFFVGLQRPRSIARFEQKILEECRRPGFAEIARYRKPVGKKKNEQTGEWEQQYAEGWSVRFAEGVIRYWGNLFIDSKSAFENDQQRIIRNVIIDLESNVTISTELNLSKSVERRGQKKGKDVVPPDGREVLGERLNTYGDKVFKVAATDDELNMKQSAHFSKFVRNVTRLVPGDILDRCEQQVRATLHGESPEAQMQKIVQAFDRIGLTVSDIQQYFGKPLSKLTHDDIDALRQFYTAIKDGETSWAEIIATKEGGSAEAQKDVASQKIAELKQQAENQQKISEFQKQKQAEKDPEAENQQAQSESAGPIPVPEPEGGLFPGAKQEGPSPYDAPAPKSPFANPFLKGKRGAQVR